MSAMIAKIAMIAAWAWTFVVKVPHPYCTLAQVLVEPVVDRTGKLHIRARARQGAYLSIKANNGVD
jgi:hypothetical protein